MKRFINWTLKIIHSTDGHDFTLFAFGMLLGVLIGMSIFAMVSGRSAANMPKPEPTTEQELVIEEYVLTRVDEPTTEESTEASNYDAVYELSASERALVESVVMAEAGGECYDGQVAVAQCILNACIRSGSRPDAVIRRFGYTHARPAASTSVINAVSAVFDKGDVVTAEPIMYFYAPAACSSPWHESQTYVLTIGGHRFFKEA